MFYKTAEFKENSSYVFEATLVHSLRMKLLTFSDYEKLADHHLESLFAFLSEKKYDVSSQKPELIFYREEEKLVQTVSSLLKNRLLEEYILLPYDFFNLKVIYKGWLKEEDFDRLPFGMAGLVEKRQLKKIFFGEESAGLPAEIVRAVKNFDKEIEEKTPFAVDLIWDKLLYRFWLEKTSQIQNPFLIKLHLLEIDLQNLLNFFRVKWFQRDFKVFQKLFLEGGNLSLHTLRQLFREEADLIAAKLSYLDYSENIKKGAEGYLKNGSLTEMEKELRKFYVSFLNGASHVIFGYEGIIAYYWLKKYEIANLRLVLAAKQHGIQREFILNGLRI